MCITSAAPRPTFIRVDPVGLRAADALFGDACEAHPSTADALESNTMANEIRARDVLRAPGMVSAVRFVLAVAFPFSLEQPWIAVALLVAAAASDVLDGWIARRLHEETAMGALLDAVADKVFVVSVLLTLLCRHRLEVRDVFLLSTREIIEAPVLAWELLRPTPFARERRASALGKATTCFQFLALLCVLLGMRYVVPMIVAATIGAVAGLAYAVRERAERASLRPCADAAPTPGASSHRES